MIVALVYVFFVPKTDLVNATTGLRFVIVRWFHSLVWVMLAISFFMRASEPDLLAAWANPVALVSGILYVWYLVTFIRLK